ncbi:2797_t:CDS:2 [Ambispora gerdemannii]|uniref:2797_t:CDS:1 n=1 Tax=Ambispora gerdemannii TaxID=144530 RepID=A0A9N8ZNX5_9GLOM|nr:2797_t:CDS:2 [Ambispora gerdemannii]
MSNNDTNDEKPSDSATTANKAIKTRVKIFGSSVSGNIFTKKNQQWVESVLTINKIPFEFVDVAADEEQLKFMKRRNLGAQGLPQIFVDNEFVGLFPAFEEAVESRQVKQWLGLD